MRKVLIGPPDNSVVVVNDDIEDELLNVDWASYGSDTTIRVIAPGYSDRNVQFWSEEEWPYAMPLQPGDFSVRFFALNFQCRIRPTKYPLPALTDSVVEELGPITDYLLTYDDETQQFGLRVREITQEQQPYWFMAKLAR